MLNIQIYYDSDLVFDVRDTVRQHSRHFNFSRWNQFKMMSKYSNGMNMTINVVGQNGKDGTSLVLLDDIVINVMPRNKTL